MKINTKILRTQSGFTLIELLVVIAIISLLVSILLPSLTKAKFLAKHTLCMTNLHSIHVAHMLYQADYDSLISPAYAGWIPAAGTTATGCWPKRLYPYIEPFTLDDVNVKCNTVLNCPLFEGSGEVRADTSWELDAWQAWVFINYGMNNHADGLDAAPAKMSLHADLGGDPEADPNPMITFWPIAIYAESVWPRLSVRHMGGSNHVFVDGHVDNLPYDIDEISEYLTGK